MSYMSGRKSILFCFIIMVFCLTACRNEFFYDDISAAVENGIIVPVQEEGALRWQPAIVEVRRGNIEREVNVAVSAEFLITYSFYYDNAMIPINYWIIDSPPGNLIFEGEPVAELFFEGSTLQEIARYFLLMDIEAFEYSYREDHQSKIRQREALQDALTWASHDERAIILLRLQRLEAQFERFMFDTMRERRRFQEQLDEVLRPFLSEQLYAPFDGVIIANTPRIQNTYVRDISIAIADYRYIQFTAIGTPEVLRHGNVFTVSASHPRLSEDLLVDMKIVSDHFVNRGFESSIRFTLRPVNEEAFFAEAASHGLAPFDIVSEMHFIFTAFEILAYDSLVLPNTAIRTEDRLEYVLIYDSGNLLKRYILRGLIFAGNSQILMGLEEGQQVVIQ